MQDDSDIRNVGRNPFVTDAVIRINGAGQIVQADTCAAAILETETESLVGRDVWELLPRSVRTRLRNEIMRVEQDQTEATVETFDARFGIWFEYHIFPEEQGIILRIRNATAHQRSRTMDASSDREQQLEERVKAESEEKDRLKAIQENLKLALAAARMATVDYDPASGTFSFSEGIHEVLGVPSESAPHTPMDLPSWIVPEDYKSHMAVIDAAVNAGEEYVSEFRIRNPETKEIRWLENRGRTTKDETGRPVRIYGTVQDITERKCYERELERRVEERTAELRKANRILRESEERVRMALKNAPIAMSMVDRNLCYVWFYHPLLPNSEKYLGKTAESFLLPKDAAQLIAMKRRVLDRGIGIRQELCHVVAGRDVCYDMLMEPLRNEAGEIEGVITVALDITELKCSQEELRKLNLTLERRAEQLRRFSIELTRTEEKERRRLASVLHDNLQQLLVAARLYVQTSLGRPMDECLRPILEKVQTTLEEAIATSRSLTAELAPPVLYKGGLPEALQWLAEWVKEKHDLEVTVASDDRTDEVDQELRVVIFQAVRELLFNVVKHAQVKGATITLCYGGDDAIAVCVRDEGVGFDPENLSANVVGGFGLMAVRERLAAMGGVMEIQSAPGQGTATTIKIPIRH